VILAALLLAGVAALMFTLSSGGSGADGDRRSRSAQEATPVRPATPAEVERPVAPATAPGAAAGAAVEREVVSTQRPPGLPANTRQSLSGRLLGAGAPLAGAQVIFTTKTGEPLVESASDARGSFELAPPFPIEDGRILVQARGFAPFESGPHAVRAGEQRFVGNLDVQRGVPLTGKVVDSGARTIAGARVDLRAIGPGGGQNLHVQSTTTDQRGLFRFADAPSGNVLLEASATGFGARAVNLLHREESEGVAIELLPEHVLFVDVRAKSGGPVAGARVSLRPHDPRSPVASAVADANGIARVQGLGSTLWEVRAEALGYRPGLVDRVEVNGPPVVLELAAWPCIRGQVRQRNGDPPPEGTRVLALSANARGSFHEGGGGAPTAVEPDGTFALCDLRPGLYVVQANAPGFAPTNSGAQRVTLGGDAADVRIVLETGGSLDLLVQRAGKPLAGASVDLYDRAPPPTEFFRTPDAPIAAGAARPLATSIADGAGHARFERLAPGPYWCLARANGLLPDAYGPVEVTSGLMQSAGPLLLGEGGRFHGTLEGLPKDAHEVVVNVFGEGSLTRGVPILIPVDAKGAWSSPLLPAGNYALTARALAGTPTLALTASARSAIQSGERREIELRFEESPR
jgi:hypothetical protein